MAFHHVAITTRDLDATHAFYTEVMGFELVRVEAAPTPEAGESGEGWARHLFYDTGDGQCLAIWDLHDPEHLPTEFDPSISRALGPPTVDEPPRLRRSRPRHARGAQAALARPVARRRRDRPRLVHVDLRRGPERHHGRVLLHDRGRSPRPTGPRPTRSSSPVKPALGTPADAKFYIPEDAPTT